MLEHVLADLAACKGSWREIARRMDPVTPDSYYSWLTKLAQGTIRDPSVNKIQRLYDHFAGRSIAPQISSPVAAVAAEPSSAPAIPPGETEPPVFATTQIQEAA